MVMVMLKLESEEMFEVMNYDIHCLLSEAVEAGDDELVDICHRALDGEAEAVSRCEDIVIKNEQIRISLTDQDWI